MTISSIPRTRWLSFATILMLLLAFLTAWQDATGTYRHYNKRLKGKYFKETSENIYRYTLGVRESWAPKRLESAVTISENGIALKCVARSKISPEAAGQYALTPKFLWISSKSGQPHKLVARLPVLIPWWLRLLVYGGTTLAFLAVFRSPIERSFWSKTAVRIQFLFSSYERNQAAQLHLDNSTNILPTIGVTLLALAVLAINSGYGRPIWLDEFLHFCLGGFDSTAEAWSVIHRTIVDFNHGQTGVYMLLDYWLLKGFGANAFALRLPSFLSTFLLLLSSVTLLRVRKFGWFWQCLALLALMAQNSHLMHFEAEARPYMPLAAATTGLLAYYLAPMEMRRRSGLRIIGWSAMLLGTLIHPYFALYWLAVFGFAHVIALLEKQFPISLKSLLQHVNLPLSLFGIAVFFSIGSLSFLRGGPTFTLDPFHWIKAKDFWETIIDCHFEFLGNRTLGNLCFWSAVILPLGYFLLSPKWKNRTAPLLAPVGLLLLAFGLTAIVSYLSYRRNYWILGRQWIASIALVPLAFIWFSAELARLFQRYRDLARLLVVVFLGLILANPVATAFSTNWKSLTDDRKAQLSFVSKTVPSSGQFTNPTLEEWVELANLNIRQKEPVWPFFQKYYQTEANLIPQPE